MQISGVVRGDTINLECNIELSSGQSLNDWKIRCEIYDTKGHCIQLATSNSGGSSDQIEITDASNGDFLIKVTKELTECFEKKSNIEIEVENEDEEVFTPIPGEENFIIFTKQKITWETPS